MTLLLISVAVGLHAGLTAWLWARSVSLRSQLQRAESRALMWQRGAEFLDHVATSAVAQSIELKRANEALILRTARRPGGPS